MNVLSQSLLEFSCLCTPSPYETPDTKTRRWKVPSIIVTSHPSSPPRASPHILSVSIVLAHQKSPSESPQRSGLFSVKAPSFFPPARWLLCSPNTIFALLPRFPYWAHVLRFLTRPFLTALTSPDITKLVQ